MGDEKGKFAGLTDLNVKDLEGSKLLVSVEDFEPGTAGITKSLMMDTIISLVTGYHCIPDNEMATLKKIIANEPPLYRTAYPFGQNVSLEMTGFVNSFLCRYPDWGDTMRLPIAKTGSGGHPCDAMALVLSLLNAPGITGKKVMELIRLSYELWGIFHRNMLVKKDAFDASSVIALTGPVLASVAFGESPERTQNAMNMGATMLGMLGCTRYAGAGGIRNMKNAACGSVIFKALWAYRMSELVECTPATYTAPMGWYENVGTFEGELTGVSDMDVFGPLELKVWPMYNVAQAPVDCAVALHGQVADRLDQIEKIVIYKTKKDIIKIATKMDHRYPHNHATADHSPYWGVAMGLKYGNLGLHHFEDKYYQDEDIRRMLGLTECVVYDDAVIDKLGGAVSASTVEITFKDGSVISDAREQHGGAFDGLTLEQREKRMSEIVAIKQKCIEEGYGYDLSEVSALVYDLENQTGEALLNAIHKALSKA